VWQTTERQSAEGFECGENGRFDIGIAGADSGARLSGAVVVIVRRLIVVEVT